MSNGFKTVGFKDTVRQCFFSQGTVFSLQPCLTFALFDPQERYIPPECLALTVDEVIHIRSVLVKAEIENLRVTPKIYHGVLKEKVIAYLFCGFI